LWLALALKRLNRPFPEWLRQRATAEASEDWPGPALALLADVLSPEQIVKIMDAKSGDEREMTRGEGYFYIGQYYAARGDKEKAREYFVKTRELNIVPYIEHIAAGFELKGG
jgi:lipoprotein NlpI